jgi:hypothetical protein
MTPEEIAWLAGIVEGEGSIFAHRQTKNGHVYVYPVLVVGMTDLDIIERLYSITGVGRIMGPYGPYDKPIHKPKWQWKVNRTMETRQLLELIRPYMGERRGAKIAAVLAETPTHVRFMAEKAS